MTVKKRNVVRRRTNNVQAGFGKTMIRSLESQIDGSKPRQMI